MKSEIKVDVGVSIAWEPGITLKEIRKIAMSTALKLSDGNIAKAARSLGVSRRTIERFIKSNESEDKDL